MMYQVVRRVLDIVILILLVVVLLPQGWFGASDAAFTEQQDPKPKINHVNQTAVAPVVSQDRLVSAVAPKVEQQNILQQPVKKSLPLVQNVQAESVKTQPEQVAQQAQAKRQDQFYLQLGIFKKIESINNLKIKISSFAVPQRIISKNGVMLFYVGPVTRSKATELLPYLAKLGIKPIWHKSSDVVKS